MSKSKNNVIYIDGASLGGGFIGSAVGGLLTNSSAGTIAGLTASVLVSVSDEPITSEEDNTYMRTARGFFAGLATSSATGAIINKLMSKDEEDDSDQVVQA